MKTAALPTLLFFSSLVLALGAGEASARQDIRESVVKILTTQRPPDFFRPWTKLAPQEMSGTGVVIEGNRILTNAHVVKFSSQIYVQPYQSSDKLRAKVVGAAPGIDLAVIELDRDPEFFESHPPLVWADELPEVKDPVSVYGYPMGGTDLSITEGIVSRIEFAPYDFEAVGLRIQVDAALNPGNSGGPAVEGERMVGVVFSGIPEAENIGYLIPLHEIRMFLADLEDGQYDGKPQAFDMLQTLENEALRARLGAAKVVTGLVVTTPFRDDGDYPLKRWDILTHIGEHDIQNDGMVFVRDNLRLNYRYYIPELARNGTAPMTVFRGGQSIQVEVPVPKHRDLVVGILDDEYPPYFIFGPLVFSPASQVFVRGIVNAGAGQMLVDRGNPMVRRLNDIARFPGEELVIVPSQLFPHPITKGYDAPTFSCLKTVNGTEIKNMRHLVEVLRDLQDEYVVFEFHDKAQEHMVFQREEIMAATEEILTDNGIRNQASDELRAIWGN